jgi:inosine/xanthosine triphosphate pyrophosphatase family protein
MFMPEAFDQTFAEMASEVKNSVSHRARALDALLADCFT